MNKRTPILALLAVGLLAVGAFATTAAAQPGDDSPSSDHRGPRERAQERMENRSAENRSADRQDRHERMRDAHDAWQACKRENSTANVSMQERCGDEKAYFLNATHARREAHAHIGAIAALERQIGRLEVREMRLQDKLDDGNLSANQTASIQERIDAIQDAQERLADKLERLKARLGSLEEKWASARDEVKERRHSDDEDDEDDEDDSESSSSSSSGSESASSTSA